MGHTGSFFNTKWPNYDYLITSGHPWWVLFMVRPGKCLTSPKIFVKSHLFLSFLCGKHYRAYTVLTYMCIWQKYPLAHFYRVYVQIWPKVFPSKISFAPGRGGHKSRSIGAGGDNIKGTSWWWLHLLIVRDIRTVRRIRLGHGGTCARAR